MTARAESGPETTGPGSDDQDIRLDNFTDLFQHVEFSLVIKPTHTNVFDDLTYGFGRGETKGRGH